MEMELFESWVAEKRRNRQLSASSESVYRAMWRSMTRTLNAVSWSSLSPEDIQAGLERLRLSSSAKRKYLQLVARVLGENSAARQVLEDSTAPQRALPQFLKSGIEDRLEQALESQGVRNKVLLHLYLGAGLRTGEAVRLTREDLFLADEVPWVAVRNTAGIASRAAPLTREAAQALSAWLAGHEDFYVFPGADSGHMDESSAWRICRGVARSALEDETAASPRRLRNAYAVRQLRAGEQLTTVANWIGHRTTSTTARLHQLAPPKRQPV